MTTQSENKNKTIVLEHTVKTLASLNALITDATQCKSESTFIFHILNHTVTYLYYDRAVLLKESGHKILGVSGTTHPAVHSLLASDFKKICKDIVNPRELQIISKSSFSQSNTFWDKYQEDNVGTSLLWIPLNQDDNTKHDRKSPPALILERWNNRRWRENDIKLALPLQKSYTGMWSLYNKHSIQKVAHKKGKGLLLLLLLLAGIVALQAYKVSERIVSPCEIVPENPESITTAIDGVIDEVHITPGQKVEKGDVLVKLTPDIFHEELIAASQQIKITNSELTRTRAQAVTDVEARGLLHGLENQLVKDKTRLGIAKYRLKHSTIVASKSGVVLMNNPHEWEGKPVMTGERIMLLIIPSNNKIQIYLPLDDKIDFPAEAKVRVILNTDSATSREAHLTYLSAHATVSPNGTPCFLAEAKFDTPVENMRMGVQGTAVIYGNKVALGYWLIRRPLAAIRNFIGI